ncbi:hypothetical protein B6I21_00950 [candidate division KSB1 bacterium 4572_119]|nr:MAG: hypothetical protein B6I21_00950 [candidate division KSB1 bacterium 4572_119]
MKRIVVIILLLFPMTLYSQNLSKVQLKEVSGKRFAFKNNLKSDATIVSFWATWCIPCRKEMDALQKIKEKFADKNIRIITISQDSPRSLAKVKSFVKTHHYDFTYLLDPGGETSAKLLVKSVPFTMLLDKNGKVIYSHRGYKKGDELEIEKELLKYWSKSANKSSEEEKE